MTTTRRTNSAVRATATKTLVGVVMTRSAALAAVMLLFVPAEGFAHGGGLDGYGCHHNRKAGGYHCHRGPMAGQSFASQEAMLKAMEKEAKKTPKKKEQ